MVQVRIEVIIDPKRAVPETKKVRAEIDKTENAADKLRKTIRNAFAVIGVGLLVRELGQAADAFTNVQNRIRTVVEGEAALAEVTSELFDIANRTRLAFDATAEVYARTALAAKDLGISQEQTLRFTESLNQAVTLSGAAAEEARAGLIQLSQGLASGALRGDELRSVLEQLPAVADVIAKSLGVTRGRLRELGAEGKITSEIILTAFEEAREELDERFGKAVPTLGQSFTVLRNNIVEAIGSLDQATGTSAILSQTIIFLSNNVDLLATGVLVLALSALPAAIVAFKAFIVQSAIFKGIATGALFNPIIIGTAAAGAGILFLIDRFVDVNEAARETKKELDGFLLTDEELVTTTIANVERNLRKLQDAAERGVIPEDGSAERIAALEEKLADLRMEQEALTDGTGRSLSQIRAQSAAVRELEQAVTKAAESLVSESEALIATSRELERREDVLKAVARIEKETGQEVTPAQREALEVAAAQAQALRDQAEAFDAIRGPAQEFEAQVAALNALLEQGRITQEEFTRAVGELADDAKDVDLSNLQLPESVDLTASLEQFRQLIEAQRQVAEAESQRRRVLDSLRTEEEEAQARKEILLSLLGDETVNQEALAEALREVEAALDPVAAAEERRRELLEELTGPEQERQQRLEDLKTLLDANLISMQLFNAEMERLAVQEPPEFGGQVLSPEAADLLERIQGPQERFAETQAALNELLSLGAISAQEYAFALNEAEIAMSGVGIDAASGMQRGLSRIENQLLDVGGAVEQTLVNGFGAAEDALVEFVRTGEADFSKLVDSILDDLARLLVRQALLALLGGPAAAGGSAAFGGGRQRGGDVNPNQAFLVGEQEPELFIPPGAGRIASGPETRGMMQPVVNVTTSPPIVNITNVSDPNEVSAALETPEGEEAVLNIIARNPRRVQQASR